MSRSVCEVPVISPVSTQTTRVYVIEPQPLMARVICAVLSEASGVSIAGSADAFDRERLAASAPDVVLIDYDAEKAGLAATIAQCRRCCPGVRVCVLTVSLSADNMLAALSAGANGYIVKDVTPDALIASVRAVSQEGFYADPRLSSVLLKRNVDKTVHDLSPRELDVVRLIGQGLSNKEIAYRLLLSDKTVKNHVANIFMKLHVNARTQVAIYALRNGLV